MNTDDTKSLVKIHLRIILCDIKIVAFEELFPKTRIQNIAASEQTQQSKALSADS